jgi:hypothetical protein
MRERPILLMERLRGFTAVLMIAVIGIVSFSAVFARAAQALPAAHANVPTIAMLSGIKTIPIKMCHRMVLPGTVNSCPLSSLSFGAVFGTDASQFPPASVAAAWRLNDSSLPPQQPGLGLYRPPRAFA